jgi:hypothetical protein
MREHCLVGDEHGTDVDADHSVEIGNCKPAPLNFATLWSPFCVARATRCERENMVFESIVYGKTQRAAAVQDGSGAGSMPRRLLFAALVVSALTFATAGITFADSWGQKLKNFPTDFVFGYGSLINSASRNSTASTPIPAIPVRVSAAFGFRRCWNDRSPSGFTALGLCKTGADSSGNTVNGVLYPVQGEDLSKFDLREEGYTRVEVPMSLMESAGWQRLPERGHIWVYIPVRPGSEPGAGLPEPDASYPLLQSYIDIVVEGGLEYGEDFAREILETTDGWSRFWLNDRELARRPWVHDAKTGKVDALIRKTAPAATHFNERLFPELYAVRWLTPAPK